METNQICIFKRHRRTTPNWKRLPADTICKFVVHLVNIQNRLEESTISPTSVVWAWLNIKPSRKCQMVSLSSSRSNPACKWLDTSPNRPQEFDWFEFVFKQKTHSTIKKLALNELKTKKNGKKEKKKYSKNYKLTSTCTIQHGMEARSIAFEHRTTIYYYYLIIYALKRWMKTKKKNSIQTRQQQKLTTKIKIWM